jgi:hypothetical protein
MRGLAKIGAIVMALALVGACTTLSDQDRALLESVNKNTADAKALALQALEASRNAQQSAAQAAAAANAANAEADRMSQKSPQK